MLTKVESRVKEILQNKKTLGLKRRVKSPLFRRINNTYVPMSWVENRQRVKHSAEHKTSFALKPVNKLDKSLQL